MSRALKYVVYDNALPVIFGDYFTHKEVGERLRRLAFEAVGGGRGEITGAGFVQRNTQGGYTCYGRSESLDIESKPGDSEIVTMVMKSQF